jgi:hypothetical protein
VGARAPSLRLVPFPLAGSGGRLVYLNPGQVVCLMDLGENRTQVVTTGLSGETSMSLIIEMSPSAVSHRLLEVD